jgi:aspartyl-tRNA synthetase
LPLESVIITGTVVKRSDDTINKNLPTGHIEVNLSKLDIISRLILCLYKSMMKIMAKKQGLKFRYLDLRRNRPHSNIILVFQTIRNMIELGFIEFQTPILTASSPEGARDFLVQIK